VFVLRAGKIMAVPIRTGLTDQDYIEVARGLTQQDTVLFCERVAGEFAAAVPPAVPERDGRWVAGRPAAGGAAATPR